jgi:hypothetical protein
LVPLIFESYALDLASRLAEANPLDMLETAAGTGVLTRANAACLPADARIVATDLNQPMLNRAKARQSHDGRIEWKPADALALPFENQSFDVVACQFGVMFFPDKVQGYLEAWRVLNPAVASSLMYGTEFQRYDFADTVTEAPAAVFPHDPPCFLARTPHGYHDVERIRAELNAAGYSDLSVDAVDHRSKASSPHDPAIAYCQGTPLRSEIEARDASRLRDATEQAADALASRFGGRHIEGRIRAFVITAIR